MKVLVTDNAHLYKTPDGKYYTPTIYSYEFFQRYLNVFDEVRFVAKTKNVDSIDTTKYLLVSGDRLEIYELPWYQGLKEMLKIIFKLILRYRKACEGCDCYIFRVAQIESYLTYILGKKCGKPFAVEVVNDPSAFFNINGLFKWINICMLKHMTMKANGASYVTQKYLQKKYPSKARLNGESENYFESSYSSIELSVNDIRNPKKYNDTKSKFEIIHLANAISGDMKGHRTLIETVKNITEHGYNCIAVCIGDGDSIPEFKNYAEELGVGDRVHFIGRFPSRQTVVDRLAQSDLFLFPSYSEGLPRCVIEAQAAGLPCLATPVGGTPELLNSKYMFAPGDSQGFSSKVIYLIENPDELEQMSLDNIEVARKYTSEKLTNKRNKFYERLRGLAEKICRT
jgi:glycosyltransferase involved in cell wall biosynthesis